MTMRDKIRGCLIGGAIGDALGYPVEFMSREDIFSVYGKGGIKRYALLDGLARISDDTQMTLFTAVSMLFGETRCSLRGIGGAEGWFHRGYKEWLNTQTKTFPLEKDDYYHIIWLVNFEEFFHRRAPGNTCISALQSGKCGTIEKPINQKKGCGGVMRVAPVGAWCARSAYCSEEDAARIGAEAAAVTHGHELGYIPAAALAHIVYNLVSGRHDNVLSAVREAVEAVQRMFPDAKHMNEFTSIMERAVKLAEAGADDESAILELGEGWVAEETLAIAVYCAVKYSHDFEKAMIAAVNHDGDSDSTGAVTGNILGAFLGYEALPDFFKEKLELSDIILEIADDLSDGCKMEEYDDYEDPVWMSKYVMCDYDAEKRAKMMAEKRV